MTQMNHPVRSLARAAALCVVGVLPVVAQAQSGDDAWKWEATIYGWFPAIGGSTSFPPSGGGPSIDVSARDVIDALKFTFMGNIGVKRGAWGAWTDLVYADFGAGKSGTRDFEIGHQGLPADVTADLNLDVKSWIWTLAGTYSLYDKPEATVDLLAGARLLDMDQTLNWSIIGTVPGLPPAAKSGAATVSLSNWDAIVGLKGRANLGDERKWFIPYYVDVGAGQSKLTWQAIAGIGYQFDWGAVIAAWRYLDYDFKSGNRVESVDFNGAAIGVQFRW